MLAKKVIESHFTTGILFTALSSLIFAPSLGWLDPNNLQSLDALLLLIVAVPFLGLFSNQRVWMISPAIGFASAFLSLLYKTSGTYFLNPGPCSVTWTDQGYPYWWIHQFTLNTVSCPVLLFRCQTLRE